ncbi:MAG: peptidase M15 [Oscillatoriales cyanobacterium CG2_30_44_21]|nr:MAG: peptidase M15 [Oscillatoriales cyanobacterium CG2_30_44_21]
MPIQNDIPVAKRISDPERSPKKQPVVKSRSIWRSLLSVPWWAYFLAVLAFLSPIVSTRIWFSLDADKVAQNSVAVVASPTTAPVPTTFTPPPFIDTDATPTAIPNQPEEEVLPTLFGHYAFAEAPANKLRTINKAGDGYEIKLYEAAAKSYLTMEAEAKADGIDFVVISGFRTIAEQQELFFEISKQRNQTPAERAKVSAPPGHSEHHTGYAVDIGDASVPSANLSVSFEKTAAFQWLRSHAAKYGFEMSFKPNNTQGVMYEPWHWRFVGDEDSLATFYKKSNRSNSFIKKP